MISENSRLRFRRLHSTGHRVCSWKVLLQEDASYLIDSSADRCFRDPYSANRKEGTGKESRLS
jgi:hypothetical protein